MRIATLAPAIVFLFGCAAMRGDTAPARDSWRGAAYDDVLARWGAPARSVTLSDGRVARTWVSETTSGRGTLLPSIGVYGGSGGAGVGTSVTVVPGGYEQVRCERTLVFRDERVVEQEWHGPADYCNAFGRAPGQR